MRDMTISELIAEGMKRADESSMDLRINKAKVIQLHLFEAGYIIVRTPVPNKEP